MEEHRRDGRGRMNRADAADGRTDSLEVDPSLSRATCAEGFWTLRTPRRVQG